MVTVYVIQSLSHDYRYTGLSADLEKRLMAHNKGYNKTTKPYPPFKLIYTKTFASRLEARLHEKYLKSGRGKTMLNQL